MENEVVIHGIYRHFKGDYYMVEDIQHIVKQEKNM